MVDEKRSRREGMSMLASLKNLADMEFLSMFSPQRQLLGLDIGSISIELV